MMRPWTATPGQGPWLSTWLSPTAGRGKDAPVLRWPIPWLQTELFKGC
jgi:hypothetical protein